MPKSKIRKKKGKKVRGHARIKVDPNKESAVTLQDLINVVAYQEYLKPDDDPTKMHIPEDVEVHMDQKIPVYAGEGEDRKQVGWAERTPENMDQVSIEITDPDMQKLVGDPSGAYSMIKDAGQDVELDNGGFFNTAVGEEDEDG